MWLLSARGIHGVSYSSNLLLNVIAQHGSSIDFRGIWLLVNAILVNKVTLIGCFILCDRVLLAFKSACRF